MQTKEIGRGASLLDDTLDARGEPREASAEADPSRIGRFVVLSRIGAGAMGTVYAAFDQQLDRKVAIKLLHPEQPEARGRLLREAQAMARVSHPNVVAVYEVGTHAKQVYLAMELVRGQTLAAWREQGGRSTAEILEVFAQAGLGLATAHATGIVHRDFKPENVLVGDDGRVRVGDFGLARPGGASRPLRRTAIPGGIPRDDRLGTNLTLDGELVGTPAYMAPEVYSGIAADARSDQFSFCVALFEALFDKRPFSGDTVAELSVAVVSGQLDSVGAGTGPAGAQRIRKVLLRGLLPDPGDRFESMEALLDALRPARPRRRTPWLVAAAGVLGVAGVAVWGLGRTPSGLPECDDQPPPGERWTEEARAAVGARLVDHDAEHGAARAEKTQTAMDDYVRLIRDATAAACAADTEADPASVRRLATERACLRSRTRELDGLLTAMADADAERLQGAHRATLALHPVVRCQHPQMAKGMVAAPVQDDVVAAAMAVRLTLGHVWALNDRGRFADAHALARDVRRAAGDVSEPALQAHALFVLAYVTARAGRPREGDTLGEEAVIAAEAASDAHRRALALAMLAISALIDHRLDAAAEWKRRADAAAAAFGPDEELEAWLAFYEGTDRTNAPELRLARFERALELYTRIAGLQSQEVVGTQHNLGNALVDAGRLDEAQEHLRTRATSLERMYGPDSTHLVFAYAGLASLALQQRQYGQARPWVGKAKRVATAAGKNAHRVWVIAQGVESALELSTGNFDAALDVLEAKLDHTRAGLDDPAAEAGNLIQQGEALVALGRPAAAMVRFERAESTLANQFNRRELVGHALYAPLVVAWASAALDNGDLERAKELTNRIDAAQRTGPRWRVVMARCSVKGGIPDPAAVQAARNAVAAWDAAPGPEATLKLRAAAWLDPKAEPPPG